MVASLAVITLTASLVVGQVSSGEELAAEKVEEASAVAVVRPVGSVLPSAPDVLEVVAEPKPTVDGIRRHLEAGDAARALRTAERLAATAPKGRERDAALMVVGVLNKERGRHNLASEAFGQVAVGGGPLAALAAYEQAEQDQLRGRNQDAIDACGRFRAKWPASPHASDCLRIQALAQAALGNAAAARSAAAAYDDAHSTGRISEQITLALANRLVETDPAAAIPLYRQLAVEHSAALAGRVSEEQLTALRSAGFAQATIPDDLESRKLRAVSLRESGRRDAAWALFDQLRKDKRASDWIEDEQERFGWQTQRWDFLAEQYAAEYRETKDPDASWKQYRVLARAARFEQAAALAVAMQKAHGDSRHGPWRKAEDEVGRTMLLARKYREARDQFDAAAARGGWSGRRAAFSAAFAAYMAGDHDDAVTRLSRIVADDTSHELEARYWRWRTYQKLGRDEAADADRTWIVANEPWSWYAGLVQQQDGERPTVEPYARIGRWVGSDPLPDTPPDPGPAVLSLPITDAPRDLPLPLPVTAAVREVPAGFAALRFGELNPAPAAPAPPAFGTGWELEPPPSYRPGTLFDPVASRKALAKFADDYAKKWPELQAVSDLASVGLYDLSGPMLNDWFELWRTQVRKRDATAKRLSGTAPEAWRQLFLAARDHNNTARNLWDVWTTLTDPQQLEEAWRLAYPLAHDRYVWTHAREHNLDPYLVLGLMRQESTYNATARSRVGARGAMQIMPRTGHLLADLQHDLTFDAGDLEDPTVAIGYGIRYLGLLMERFGGVYPLAVASYNGGPFNVSTWMQGTGVAMPIDELVEHVPFRETRDYVKKVTEGYSAYIALYAPQGSALGIPPIPAGDRREVVDF